MRQHRVIAALIGLSTTAAVAAVLALDAFAAGPVGATTRLRSGALHVQLASHISSAAAGTAPHTGPLALAGANVMAIVVGTLAVAALVYMVATLVRRRFITA